MRYVAGVAAVVLLLFGLYLWGYRQGANETRAEYESAIEEERLRQEQIRREAKIDAARRIEELEAVIAAREEDLERLQNEAASDPAADNLSIGPDSVRRLNTID